MSSEMRKNPVIILVGPSGVGKSTLVSMLLEDNTQMVDIITYTTRPMRPNEKEGDPYHFVSQSKFEELKAKSFFVETAWVHTNQYGTPLDQIESAWKTNRIVLMDVDVQGAATFKRKFPQSLTIFILPPSINMLRQRLENRPGSKSDDLELRMTNAKKEIDRSREFDHHLINDDLKVCFVQLKKLIEEYLSHRV